MDFAFSPEQDEFREMLQRFFAERWPTAEVRKLAETPAGFDRSVWKQMAEELGLQGLALPEAVGGQGFGFLELGIALEEMGRQLCGGPYLATCLAAQAIRHAGDETQQAEWLTPIASGDAIATLAFGAAPERPEPEQVRAECREGDGGWCVSGSFPLVLDAHNADWLVVAARAPGSRGDDGVSLLVVDASAAGLAVKPAPGLDLTRKLATLELRDAPARPLGAPGAGWPALQRTLDEAAVALAAEAVGGTARCLEMAVAYAKDRVQFARPIGSFQAIKHKAAEVTLELESARSAAYWSWWVASRPDAEPAALAEAASVAKSFCGDAYRRAAAENIQIHGGMGFTWEFDCHLFQRRATASDLLLGDAVWHRARLGTLLGF